MESAPHLSQKANVTLCQVREGGAGVGRHLVGPGEQVVVVILSGVGVGMLGTGGLCLCA